MLQRGVYMGKRGFASSNLAHEECHVRQILDGFFGLHRAAGNTRIDIDVRSEDAAVLSTGPRVNGAAEQEARSPTALCKGTLR